MKLPASIREAFRRHGRSGGLRRAARLSASERRAISRRAVTARWLRHRFGQARLAESGLPGGDLVDAGLADLAAGRTSLESLLVSLAAPRLRREGVPICRVEEEPERRLYEMLAASEGDLAHARYTAYLRQMTSFADACRTARIDHAA